MKKILFLHGFTSSGSCEIVEALKSEMADMAEIVAPDLPLHPYAAMDMLKDLCDSEQFDLLTSSTCHPKIIREKRRDALMPFHEHCF